MLYRFLKTDSELREKKIIKEEHGGIIMIIYHK